MTKVEKWLLAIGVGLIAVSLTWLGYFFGFAHAFYLFEWGG